eukprot:1842981-Amphidinium_carterae.2
MKPWVDVVETAHERPAVYEAIANMPYNKLNHTRDDCWRSQHQRQTLHDLGATHNTDANGLPAAIEESSPNITASGLDPLLLCSLFAGCQPERILHATSARCTDAPKLRLAATDTQSAGFQW